MKKIIFLGQYEIEPMNAAPKVRTYYLYKALSTLENVDFITGYRAQRRWPLLKYLFQGKLFKADAVYLESATSTSMEIDILFLFVAFLLRKPIGIYIRDAHPYFDMVWQDKSLKSRLLVLAWHMSIWFYHHLATQLYFPSEPFAQVFYSRYKKKYTLLPPGSVKLPYLPFNSESRKILYAGGLGSVYGGINKLLLAVESLSKVTPNIELICVCREYEIHLLEPWLNKPWLNIQHLNSSQIHQLRSEVYLSVISLAKTDYADLALPVKLFDYMAMGRPIVVTDVKEMSLFIENNRAGLTSSCTQESFQENIEYLFNHPEEAEAIAKNNHLLANTKHNWKNRAKTIIETLI